MRPLPHHTTSGDRFADGLLLAYVALGVYGGLWVHQDDYEAWRLTAFAFAGVPTAVFYLAAGRLAPGWRRRAPTLARAALLVMAAVFAPGHALLVNAVTAEPGVVKRTVSAGGGIAVRDVRRGGLGVLYTTRW